MVLIRSSAIVVTTNANIGSLRRRWVLRRPFECYSLAATGEQYSARYSRSQKLASSKFPTLSDSLTCQLSQSVQTSCALLGLGLSGVILAFVTHHKYVFFACCVVMTTFVGVMVSVQPGQTAKAASSVALISGSCGIIECASRSLLPLSCPDEDIGAAIGILGTFGFGSSSVASRCLASTCPTVRLIQGSCHVCGNLDFEVEVYTPRKD